MIEDCLSHIEVQKRKNLEELKKVFDACIKVLSFEKESRENIFRLSIEYTDFFIQYNELEISIYNDNYQDIKQYQRQLKKFSLSDIVTWKTHKGKKISDLMLSNGHYIIWAVLNLDFFIIDNSFFLMDYLRKYPDYKQAFEINLLKQYVYENYDENYDDG